MIIDATDKTTQMFFAETQNKLLYAVTHQTAAQIVISRADASALNMSLTSWKGKIVRKGDVVIAKNYLNSDEIDSLNRLTVLLLDSAEMRVKERKDLTLNFWRENVNGLLSFQGKDILKSKGNISNAEMEKIAAARFAEFDKRRKIEDVKKADQDDLDELNHLLNDIKDHAE